MLGASLAVLLVVVGVAHWVFPRYFETLVPPWMPAHRTVVLSSGAAEVALGMGLLVSATRTLAALAVVGLFAVYVGTHVDAFVRSRRGGAAPTWLHRTPAAVARVVVNLGYLGWAIVVAWTSW